MDAWKKAELDRLYREFSNAQNAYMCEYHTIELQMLNLLVAMGYRPDSTFEEKRQYLDERIAPLSTPYSEREALHWKLARSWSLVGLHPNAADEPCYRASADSLAFAGEIWFKSDGEGAFMWSWYIGKMLELWHQGLNTVLRNRGRKATDESAFFPRRSERSHPSLITLPNCLSMPGCYTFMQDNNAKMQWEKSGARLLGRLLFTHALSIGVSDLNRNGLLHKALPLVNGGIVGWPQPLVKDLEFTRGLLRKWGVEQVVSVGSPGYFSSLEWSQSLSEAAQNYLASYDALFGKAKTGPVTEASAWRRLGESLQIFSQPV